MLRSVPWNALRDVGSARYVAALARLRCPRNGWQNLNRSTGNGSVRRGYISFILLCYSVLSI